jgi:hypothetical protein
MAETIRAKFEYYSNTWSDIYEHLPTLYRYAKECDRILETGVRGCISSWAFLYGLMESDLPGKKYLLLNDIDSCDIQELLECSRDVYPPIQVEYQWINNLELNLDDLRSPDVASDYPVDMVFIDTWHVYGQLKRELAKFAPLTRKYIIMHDTTVDEFQGETIRSGMNVEEQIISSGFPRHEILCGLGPAISEFLQQHPEWILKEKYTNNNGLTVLQRIAIE